MLLELINGKPPYLGESIDLICLKILTLNPPEVDENRWSPHMRSFLQLCFLKDPVLRPSTSELLNHPFLKEGSTDLEIEHSRQEFLKILLPFREAKSKEAAPETILMAAGANNK
jgi:serine/threonine protein kinase